MILCDKSSLEAELGNLLNDQAKALDHFQKTYFANLNYTLSSVTRGLCELKNVTSFSALLQNDVAVLLTRHHGPSTQIMNGRLINIRRKLQFNSIHIDDEFSNEHPFLHDQTPSPDESFDPFDTHHVDRSRDPTGHYFKEIKSANMRRVSQQVIENQLVAIHDFLLENTTHDQKDLPNLPSELSEICDPQAINISHPDENQPGVTIIRFRIEQRQDQEIIEADIRVLLNEIVQQCCLPRLTITTRFERNAFGEITRFGYEFLGLSVPENQIQYFMHDIKTALYVAAMNGSYPIESFTTRVKPQVALPQEPPIRKAAPPGSTGQNIARNSSAPALFVRPAPPAANPAPKKSPQSAEFCGFAPGFMKKGI